jgi:hypothetical protein
MRHIRFLVFNFRLHQSVLLFVFFLSVIGFAILANCNVLGGLLYTLVEYLWWRRVGLTYDEYVFVCSVCSYALFST